MGNFYHNPVDRAVRVFDSGNQLPSADAYGSGPAQAGSDIYSSDGLKWKKYKGANAVSRLKDAVLKDSITELANSGLSPTILVGADFAGSTITNSVYYPVIGPHFYRSCNFPVGYNTQGRDVYGASISNYGSGVDAGVTGAITFVTDADAIEFDVQAQTGWNTQVIVDGKRLADTAVIAATVASGNIRKLIKCSFGSIRTRTITIFATSNIAGIYIGDRFQLFAAKTPDLTMLSIEDSYGGGGYYDFNAHGTTLDLSAAIGFAGHAISAIGGTGYTSRGASNYKTAYERLRGYIESGYAPDIVTTILGINDDGSAQNLADIQAYYDYIKSALPGSLAISFGAICPQANQIAPQPKYTTITNKIRDVLAASGIDYIFINPLNGNIHSSWGTIRDNSTIQADYLNHPNALFTGSSFVGGSAVGNTSLYINSDLTHPDQPAAGSGAAGLSSGRAYISKYLLNAVRQALKQYK